MASSFDGGKGASLEQITAHLRDRNFNSSSLRANLEIKSKPAWFLFKTSSWVQCSLFRLAVICVTVWGVAIQQDLYPSPVLAVGKRKWDSCSLFLRFSTSNRCKLGPSWNFACFSTGEVEVVLLVLRQRDPPIQLLAINDLDRRAFGNIGHLHSGNGDFSFIWSDIRSHGHLGRVARRVAINLHQQVRKFLEEFWTVIVGAKALQLCPDRWRRRAELSFLHWVDSSCAPSDGLSFQLLDIGTMVSTLKN